MKKFRLRQPPIIQAAQFQWKDGEGIPDIAGVKFLSWKSVDTDYGIKQSPDYHTAYIEAGIHGRMPVNRGDWIVRQGENITLCSDDYFRANYEEAA